ncbi:MAG: tetratricopeptide repeat protein [Candidatus Kapaibacterium sp.]
MKKSFIDIIITILILNLLSCSSAPKEIITKDFKDLSKRKYERSAFSDKERQDIANRLITDASVYKQQARYADAIVEYLEALKWDNSASIHFALAESYWALGKEYSTIESCHKSIEQDSLFIPAYELLFEVYMALKLYDEAYTVADQILIIEPSRENKLRYAILKSVNNPDESRTMLENMLTDSTDTELMLILSSAYEQSGELDKMAKLLDRMHRDQPSNFDVANGLISYYTDKEEFEKVFNVLDKSEKFFDPKQIIHVYNNFGISLISSNSPEKHEYIKQYITRIDERFYFEWITQSIVGKLSSQITDTLNTNKHYDRAFSLNDTNAFLFMDAAITYSEFKDYQKAMKYLMEGKEKFSDDMRFDFYISNLYMIQKKYDSALVFAENLYENDSNDVINITLLASIKQELKQYEESDRLYEKSIMMDPEDANTNNNYAYSLAIRGIKLNKALRFSKLSLEREPNNAAYLDTYGWIQYQLGNYDSALEFTQKAIDTGDVSAEVFHHLGDIYIKLKENDLAVEAFKKSLELDENNIVVLEKINKLKN